MSVNISKELEWFRPYLKKVEHLVPIHRLEKIVALRPSIKRVHHAHARLVEVKGQGNSKLDRVYISMNLHYIKTLGLKPVKRKVEPFSKIDLLEHLAHELAHLVDFDHTPKHKKLESKIASIFMTLLQKSGYVSEEHELKHARPIY